MTKADERKFYKEVIPFIQENLSFVITEEDRKKYSCGVQDRVLIERDGYNYETSKHVLGSGRADKGELIEYRILRTKIPYKYEDYLISTDKVFTESCWVHLKRINGAMDINCYEKIKRRQNCCDFCLLCDPKTQICKSFSIKNHNKTKKHIQNIIMYNTNIKENLAKRFNDDLIREIMSYL